MHTHAHSRTHMHTVSRTLRFLTQTYTLTHGCAPSTLKFLTHTLHLHIGVHTHSHTYSFSHTHTLPHAHTRLTHIRTLTDPHRDSHAVGPHATGLQACHCPAARLKKEPTDSDKDLECLLEGVLTCLELSPWSDSPARAAQAARGRTWRRSAPLGAGGEGG